MLHRAEKFFVVLAVVVLAAACAGNESTPDRDGLDSESDTSGCPRGEAPATLAGATLEGRTVTLTLTYDEGCAAHSFAVWWSGAAGMSDPPQLPLELHHFVTGETCGGVGNATVVIDLSRLDEVAEGVPSKGVRFDLIPAWPVEPGTWVVDQFLYMPDAANPAAPTGAIGVTVGCGGITG